MCAATAVSCVAPVFLYGQLDSGSIARLSGALQWTLIPACGLLTAYYVTRRGINRYLSWLLPPACYSLLPFLILGYSPNAGVMLLCAFVSVVGAAAGEVKNRMEAQNDKK